MTDETSGRWPFLDLLIAAGLVVGTLVVVFGTTSTAVRAAVGVPTLLFVPGYAIVTALYPRARPERAGSDEIDGDEAGGDAVGGNADEMVDRDADGMVGRNAVDAVPPRALTATERFGLSMTASLVVVGLVTLISGLTPWGISAGPVVVGVAGVTLVAVVAAVGTRLQVRPEERPMAGLGRRAGGSTDDGKTNETAEKDRETDEGGEKSEGLIGAFRRDSTGATLLNVAVLVSLVVALALVAFQPFGSPVSGGFSEYQLLAEGDDGDLAATNYPTELTEGEAGDPIFVQIQNHEGQAMEYTVVAQLQEVDVDEQAPDGGGETPDEAHPNADERSLNVTQTSELDRFDVSIPAGESRTVEHEPTPPTTGELRLVYLFYEGDVPDEPTEETADETLHLWIDVTDPDEVE